MNNRGEALIVFMIVMGVLFLFASTTSTVPPYYDHEREPVTNSWNCCCHGQDYCVCAEYMTTPIWERR